MPSAAALVTYSGYRGEETPRTFRWQGAKVEVAEISSRWTEEGVGNRDTKRRFRLIGTDGVAYSLIYDEQTQEWFCEEKGEICQEEVILKGSLQIMREDNAEEKP